jgi:hypothetical protein
MYSAPLERSSFSGYGEVLSAREEFQETSRPDQKESI